MSATPHGDTFVGIGIGERDYWGKGYGTDAMKSFALRFWNWACTGFR
jgi:RimJ/RimL family protein N-acetyltransferase